MADIRTLRFLVVANVPPDPNSGAAGTVYATNIALRKLGHDVDEIWSDRLGPRRIAHGNLHSLLEQPRAYRREVLKAVAAKDYDVVMISQPQACLAAKALKASGFQGVILNRSHGVELRVEEVLPGWHRRLGVPASRFPQSLATPLMRRLLLKQWPNVARYSDGIVVASEMDRDAVLRGTGAVPERVRTIPHGFPEEFERIPVVPMTAERQRRILYVGQPAFIKGATLLPQIVNDTLSRVEDATMTWVTAANAHPSIEQSLRDDIRDRITLIAWQSQHELVRLYDTHGVFLFPSLFEGAGKASLEAMARGMCVVASDTGAMRDGIENGVNGYLCDVGDVQAFADRLVAAVEHNDLASIFSRAANDAREYTWSRCAAGIAAFAEELRDTADAGIPTREPQATTA